MKRGQFTLFAILGIIIIIIIGLVLVYSSTLLSDSKTELSEEISSSEEVEEYYTSMDECLKSVVLDSLIYLGEHGGFYDESIKNYAEGGVPELKDLEKEFENFLEVYSEYCLYYVDFEDYEYSPERIEVNVDLSENSEFNINYPITLEKDNSSYTLGNNYDFKVGLDLGKYLELGESITTDYLEYDGLCVTCVNRLSTTTNMKISFMMQENQTLIIIEDNNVEYLEEEVYYFAFLL